MWPLCYAKKQNATQTLLESGQFYEGEDYVLLTFSGKQTEAGSGGHNRQVYMLSVPCMEYLIARKVRAVFEVYRRVFHEFLNMKRMSDDDIVLKAMLILQSRVETKGTLLANQAKRIAKYKSQLESEKDARRERLAITSEVKSDDVDKWLSESGIKGLYKLSDLHRQYHRYCGNSNSEYLTTRRLGYILRQKGYISIHKRNGTWFII